MNEQTISPAAVLIDGAMNCGIVRASEIAYHATPQERVEIMRAPGHKNGPGRIVSIASRAAARIPRPGAPADTAPAPSAGAVDPAARASDPADGKEGDRAMRPADDPATATTADAAGEGGTTAPDPPDSAATDEEAAAGDSEPSTPDSGAPADTAPAPSAGAVDPAARASDPADGKEGDRAMRPADDPATATTADAAGEGGTTAPDPPDSAATDEEAAAGDSEPSTPDLSTLLVQRLADEAASEAGQLAGERPATDDPSTPDLPGVNKTDAASDLPA